MANIWIKAGDRAGDDKQAIRDNFVLREQREQHAAERRAAMDDRMLVAGPRDLRHVEWPEVPYYGHDHGKQTSELAVYLAQVLKSDHGERITTNDLHVIKGAAYFHDLGRTLPWNEDDVGHRERSAELAAKAMALDTENWVPPALREEVCRMILAHRLDGPPPTDPRLIVLWDAECLEGARIEPNTSTGLTVIGKRAAKLITPWCREPSIQRRWREHRGWHHG